MSINLIEIAQDYLSDAVVGKISSSIGLDPNTAQGIIGKVFPSLLGSFVDKAQTGAGASELFNTVNDSDSGILDNLLENFSGDNSQLINQGSKVLSSLLGGRLDSLSEVLGAVPGLSNSKAGSLLGLLTPFLTGVLKKQVVKSGLTAGGLTSLLNDQKGHISSSLGGDFLSKIGFSSLAGSVGKAATNTLSSAGNAVTSVGKTTSGAISSAGKATSGAIGGAACAVGSGASHAAAATTQTAQKAGGGLMKIIPVLLLGLLALLGFKMCKKEGVAKGLTGAIEKSTKAVSDAGSATLEGAKQVGSATGSTLGDIKDGAVDLGNQAIDTASSATSAVIEGVQDVTSAAGDTLENVADGAVNLGDQAIDVVKEAGEGIGNAAEAVTETLGDGAQSATDTIESIIDNAADVEETVIETASEPAPETVDSFLPSPEEGSTQAALSEKTVNLARGLSNIQVDDVANIDLVYSQLGEKTDSKFLYRIPFATGQTGVPSDHQAALIAKLKEAHPEATLVTIGYADTRGDDALNKKLSYGRAKEVGAWIKSTLGADKNLESFSMGETDRFSKDEFSKNRVVEVWQTL